MNKGGFAPRLSGWCGWQYGGVGLFDDGVAGEGVRSWVASGIKPIEACWQTGVKSILSSVGDDIPDQSRGQDPGVVG